MLNVIMLNGAIKSIILVAVMFNACMLKVIMLNVILLNAIMLNAILLNVAAPWDVPQIFVQIFADPWRDF